MAERDKRGRFIKTKEDRHCLNCGKVLCRYGHSIRCKSCANIYYNALGLRGMKGKKQSEKQKQIMKNMRLGKKMSQDQKDKISKTNKEIGLTPPKRYWFKKGCVPSHRFPKGEHPWNYIDGRSEFLGPDRYGDDWNKIRLTIYKRDNYTCQECSITMAETKKAHHIHHKIPFVESRDNSFDNLITLCPSCHRKIEAKLMRERKLGGGSKS